jgi:hypothetical protein
MRNSYGVPATREYLLTGAAITRLEAMVFFAVPDLTKIISDLRREGHQVERRAIPLSDVLKRLNESARLVPPPALPVCDIALTEYWLTK